MCPTMSKLDLSSSDVHSIVTLSYGLLKDELYENDSNISDVPNKTAQTLTPEFLMLDGDWPCSVKIIKV